MCPFDPNPEIGSSLGSFVFGIYAADPMVDVESVLVAGWPRLEQSVHSESCGRWSHSQKSQVDGSDGNGLRDHISWLCSSHLLLSRRCATVAVGLCIFL